jgi:hypothetical protein
MKHLIATLLISTIVLGAVIATLLGWRYSVRGRPEFAGPRWRSVLGTTAVVLVTLSVLGFAAYLTRNAIFKVDPNGDWTTLIFIRTGNYLSLAGAFASLAGKGKERWPVFVGACLMLFIWFSQGMSL